MASKNDLVYANFYREHLRNTHHDRQKYNQAAQRTWDLERMYTRILMEMAANRFKWHGLPNSVDVRFLELQLLTHGLCIYYFDERYGKHFALKGTGIGSVDFVDNYTEYQVYGYNFISKRIPAHSAVAIWNNYLRTPDTDIIRIYAFKLAELDRTIEINSRNARRTKLLVVDEDQRLSGQHLVNQFDNGEGMIAVSRKGYQDTMLEAIDLGVDADSIEKLHILRVRLWSEAMGLLGIDNANQDKKERLVASEVDANSEQTSAMKHVALNARRMACYAINERFPGHKVSVEFHIDADNAEPPQVGLGLPALQDEEESEEVDA